MTSASVGTASNFILLIYIFFFGYLSTLYRLQLNERWNEKKKHGHSIRIAACSVIHLRIRPPFIGLFSTSSTQSRVFRIWYGSNICGLEITFLLECYRIFYSSSSYYYILFSLSQLAEICKTGLCLGLYIPAESLC